ncbi:FAS-associated factor 1 [Neocloeon triangulifer]|uniref:FAS-associated factor 1 n=1 Tax=Neocloeon triangulifer TaxID=2078957 RepID=UPI00286F15CB|nr:FAS-associated factor 1 [Neocloeon triangulifer]
MSENRDEILMDFQACTGIEDVGEAFSHLEAAQWDLLKAIQRVMPQDSQTLPSETTDDIEMIEPALPSASTAPNIAGPSTSQALDRITFHVTHGDQEVDFIVNKKDKIEYLKQLVGTKFNLPSCRVDLQGWRRTPASDKITFGDLRCPPYVPLVVVVLDPTPDGVAAADEPNMIERLTNNFTLNIKNEANQKTYNLKFPGSRTIAEVKHDIFELTDIPVRHQKWAGWPPSVSDQVTLACSGINYPEQNLTLSRQASAKENKKKQPVICIDDSDSSQGDYEDASESLNGDDDMLYMGTVETSRKVRNLIPEDVDDEIAGSISFMEEYVRRYGEAHPLFLQDTLAEAVKEAFNKPARERRPLVIYIHHDGSVLANVFCTQVLNSEPVISYLSEHFVIWGWDFTHEQNKQMMLRSASQSLGPMAANLVRSIDLEHMPALVVANKIRSSIEIVSVMHGHLVVNELISNLMQVRDRFQENQTQEIMEENERMARERVLREQDEAYQASLEIDRAKEEAKKAQEVAKEREEQLLQSHQRQEAAKMEARKAEASKRLPKEPADADGVARIRFRLPSGEFRTRRFHGSSPLQVLFDYLLIEGYPPEDYKVLSSWPRRDLTALDSTQTLQHASLCPQETVILEER